MKHSFDIESIWSHQIAKPSDDDEVKNRKNCYAMMITQAELIRVQ